MQTAENSQAAEGILASNEAFHAWATAKIKLGDLSDDSIAKYQPLWNAWVAWCVEQETPWNAVQSSDIQKFLSGPAPGKGVSRRQAINPDRMSSHTSQRYFRLLFGVYTNASKLNLIGHNPAMDLDEVDRPSIAAHDRLSQVLEPFLFARLVKVASIEAAFPQTTDANWWYARDRAILAVLIETGVTVAELISLRGVDLVDEAQGRAVASPAYQQSLLSDAGPAMRLDVMETSQMVARSLPIRASFAPLIRAWLVWRETLIVERSLLAPEIARDQFMWAHGLHGPLFVARRARSGPEMCPSMDAASVYRAASKALVRIRRMEGVAALNYVAKGPGIIRNSVIRRWIDVLGPSEAAARAGLKNEASLRLRVKNS